jgi:hypothetical protein
MDKTSPFPCQPNYPKYPLKKPKKWGYRGGKRYVCISLNLKLFGGILERKRLLEGVGKKTGSLDKSVSTSEKFFM